ncbi:MAG: Bax inhibitor-1/YccA family protein [Alphaproteobacteria bacterium]
MANPTTVRNPAAATVHNAGLARYMSGTFALTGAGIGLAFAVSYWLATATNFVAFIKANPLAFLVAYLVAAIGLIVAMSRAAKTRNATMAQLAYWPFCGLLGTALAYIHVRYAVGSIVQVFALTTAMFAALALYGYTTKRNLSGWGTFLLMGLVGIIGASLLNVFLVQSLALKFAINIVGVLVFAGFTAYDVQSIKDTYAQEGDHTSGRIFGAVGLVLDFINLFQHLLSLVGMNPIKD